MIHTLTTDRGTFRLAEAPREELEKALIEAYRMLEAERVHSRELMSSFIGRFRA